MKCVLIFLSLVFVVSSCTENVDSVIKKNLEIRGGTNNFENLKSIEMNMQLYTVGIQIPLHLYLEKPMKMRTEMKIGNQSVTTILYENRGWSIVDGKINELNGESLEELKSNYYSQSRYITSELFDIRNEGGTISKMSKAKIQGKNAYKIQIDFKDGQRKFVFIDPSTYLNLGTITEKKIQGYTLKTETIYSDYRKVKNFFIPFKMEIFTDKMNVVTLKIDSIIFDRTFQQTIFNVE